MGLISHLTSFNRIILVLLGLESYAVKYRHEPNYGCPSFKSNWNLQSKKCIQTPDREYRSEN